jgi:hypothetical protein
LSPVCRQHTASGIVYFNESNDIEKFKKMLILMKNQTNETITIDDEKMDDGEEVNTQENKETNKRKLID